MPRTARKKHPGALLHIMVRSISEVSLFRDTNDRDKFLEIIKKYQDLYMFNIYAYCLMTTHAHLIVDCCGSDISKIMKSINQSYVLYYNKRYGRHGHLFQDRFKSKIVDNDRYLIALSAYIHNNPKDIKQYQDDVSKYPYSSLGVYLGLADDKYKIVNIKFILQHFSNDILRARQIYLDLLTRTGSNIKFIETIHIEKDFEFVTEKSEYRSERRFVLRELSHEEVKKFIAKYIGHDVNLYLRYNHQNNELKSLFIVIMRSLGNFPLKDLCNILGNITLSNVWRLSQNGSNIIRQNPQYKNILQDFLTYKTTV